MRSCGAIWVTWPNFMISLGHISVLVVNAVHVIGSRKRARRLKPPIITVTPSECNFPIHLCLDNLNSSLICEWVPPSLDYM